MPAERVDSVVIGAGVAGLAVARSLALAGREVIVLEAEGAIGTATSSRNSEVIHAGIYYSPGSLKAKLCVAGRLALYPFLAERGIPHRRCGKLIVATDQAQIPGLEVGGAEPMRLLAQTVVNCAGLFAQDVARSIGGFPAERIPPTHYCKGNYFSLSGRSPFARLVYPAPEAAGLGVHLTLDLAGRARFGPDVEWIERVDYDVDPGRAEVFYNAIRSYWPDLKDGALQPAYSGIRPKLQARGQPASDFRVQGPADHGVPGLVNLFGIESPGLTAALAIGDHVRELVRG